jgi:TRAP-type C4-dicarboxylate transport system permease small subunit
MKNMLAFFAVAGIVGLAIAAECWLDRHHAVDWVQNVFLAATGLSFALLMLALAFHFGRFA